MQHTSDESLVFHYYGEDPGAADHLQTCEECRTRYATLQRDLNAMELPVPERGSDYEAAVWSRLAPRLGRSAGRSKQWSFRQFWVPATAAAAIIVAVFFLGRWTAQEGVPTARKADPGTVRERVLVVAVGEHLERSQMVIAELVNGPGASVGGTERALAESLLGANRLYRQTAAITGDAATASLLEDVERVLIEIAHAPDDDAADDKAGTQNLALLRQRIEQQGLLFRIRVSETQLKGKLAQENMSSAGRRERSL